MIPAFRPWSSACWPSVAETWLWLISLRSIGSAPIWRKVARSCASCDVKPPEISAPVRPSIPSGFSAKLMIGRVTASLSRTTAKWPESAAASWRRRPARSPAPAPRWAIRRVTSWNASRPSSVKPKVTLGLVELVEVLLRVA